MVLEGVWNNIHLLLEPTVGDIFVTHCFKTSVHLPSGKVHDGIINGNVMGRWHHFHLSSVFNEGQDGKAKTQKMWLWGLGLLLTLFTFPMQYYKSITFFSIDIWSHWPKKFVLMCHYRAPELEVEEENQVHEMTLDEWKNLQEQTRPKPEFNIRKPESTVPSKAVVIHKSRYRDDVRLLYCWPHWAQNRPLSGMWKQNLATSLKKKPNIYFVLGCACGGLRRTCGSQE